MWKQKALLAVGFVILLTSMASAGNTVSVVCKDEKCGFKDTVLFGGGFVHHRITGYCSECEKFVYLTWTREGKKVQTVTPPPTPLAKVWIPTTGTRVDIYACPNCNKPFIPIKSANNITHCPKCGGTQIRTRSEGTFD